MTHARVFRLARPLALFLFLFPWARPRRLAPGMTSVPRFPATRGAAETCPPTTLGELLPTVFASSDGIASRIPSTSFHCRISSSRYVSPLKPCDRARTCNFLLNPLPPTRLSARSGVQFLARTSLPRPDGGRRRCAAPRHLFRRFFRMGHPRDCNDFRMLKRRGFRTMGGADNTPARDVTDRGGRGPRPPRRSPRDRARAWQRPGSLR